MREKSKTEKGSNGDNENKLLFDIFIRNEANWFFTLIVDLAIETTEDKSSFSLDMLDHTMHKTSSLD